MPQGLFIVIDGPDGCGKSTQAALLVERLIGTGRTVIHLREPGGTPAGERIRELLLDPAVTLGTAAETFLFMAARAELAPVIRDLLDRGSDVVCERWISSTIAYQGVAGGFGAGNVVALGHHAIGTLTPSILILLDLPPEQGLARVTRGLDRMERKGIDYHRRVRDGYLEARSHFPRTALVDAARQQDRVAAEIGVLVEALL